jgi:signal transduction histidine kinase
MSADAGTVRAAPWPGTVSGGRVHRFPMLVMALRWATVVTGALISLVDLRDEIGALTASALLCFYTGLRVLRPLPAPDGRRPVPASIVVDLAVALFAVVISGGWGSPFLFVVLVGVLLAGFTYGYAGGFAAASAAAVVLLAAGFAFPSAEGSSETVSQVVLVYAASAAVAGYARRLFVDAAADQARFEDRVSRLTEANALLSQLTGVALGLPSSLNLGETVATAMAHLQELVEFTGGAILVFDAATGTWRAEAAAGLPAPAPMTTHELPSTLRQLVVGHSRGAPSSGAVVEPGLGPPSSRRSLWPQGTSGAYVPLVARGRLVALVALEDVEPSRFGEREAEILTGVAEPLALAIDNGLWFERLRMLGAEGERDRLARDLHDRFAQGLAYVNLELDRLARHPSPGPALADLRQEVRGLLSEVRETQRQLRSRVTPEVGLADLLATELPRFAERTGLEVDLVSEAGDTRLPLAMEQEFWRIAQEALSNVERHAKATAVRFSWSCDGRHGRLVMADNGTGFDLAAVARAATPSAGMTAMRERANAIGARLAVDSQPGGGTWISVDVDTGVVPSAP